MPLFIHAADIHLDSPLKGLIQDEMSPDIEEIRGATRVALENLVTLVLQEQADFLIISGDLYDGHWQDFSTGLYFAKQMQRLAIAQIPVAIVRGNHDAANKMTKTLVLPDNVKIFSSRKPESWHLERIGVVLHGQSYASPDVQENLALSYPPPIPGLLNIGVLHCLLSGAKGHQPYAACTTDDLAARGYDYWALGHVHEHRVVQQQPHIVYPGCSQGRHIRETGAKGCVVVDTNGGEITTEFTPLDVVRWLQLDVDISGVGSIEQLTSRVTDTLGEHLAHLEGRICCLRVTLTGRCPIHGQLLTDTETLLANLKAQSSEISHNRVWLEKIEVHTRAELDIEQLAESDSPQGELLRYMQEIEPGPAMFDELDFSQLKAKLAGSSVTVDTDNPELLLQRARDILITMLEESDDDGGSP